EAGKVTRAGFLLGQVDALDKFFTWIITNGSSLYDGKQSRTLFNTAENREKTIESFRLLLDLQYTSSVSLPFEGGRDTSALLSQKKAAIVEGGNWNLPRYSELFPDLKLDVVLYPSGPKGQKPTTHTWTNMQVLPANTKNADWGWKWIELHSSTPSLAK